MSTPTASPSPPIASPPSCASASSTASSPPAGACRGRPVRDLRRRPPHRPRRAEARCQTEGLVEIVPNRGARVAGLDAAAITSLYELRAALEVEAAHLALAKHGDRLPPSVHEAAEVLARACRRARPSWPTVSRAHADLHTAIVRAARSPRIQDVHDRLTAQTRLFLLLVRPHYTFARLAEEHLQLIDDLETHGPDVLRQHLRASAGALVDGVLQLDA